MNWSADLSLFDDAVCNVVVVDFNAEDVDTVTLFVVAALSILLVILSLVDLTLDFEVLEGAFVLFIVPTLVALLPVLLDFLTRLKSLFEELLDVGSSEMAESVL